MCDRWGCMLHVFVVLNVSLFFHYAFSHWFTHSWEAQVGFEICKKYGPHIIKLPCAVLKQMITFHVSPDTPALLTRMWRAFSSSRIRLANSLTETRDDKSTRCRWTSEFPVFSLISLSAAFPRASFRQARITRAPRRAKSRAMNFPIPVRGGEGKKSYYNKKMSTQQIRINTRLFEKGKILMHWWQQMLTHWVKSLKWRWMTFKNL